MAIKINWKIVSSKTKKTTEVNKKIISVVWKEVWWIDWKDLDLYNWTIIEEFEITYKVKGFNRNKYKNPNKDYWEFIVDKLKIQYG